MSPPHKIEISPNYFVWSNNKDILYHANNPSNGIPRWVDPKVEVDVYHDAAKGWFFDIANQLRSNVFADFVVLQTALSHVEGIERYRLGRDNYVTVTKKNGQQGKRFMGSREVVRRWCQRTFPNCSAAQDKIYTAARCGLFHDGFVKRYFLVRRNMAVAVVEENGTVVVDPERFLDIVSDDLHSLVQSVVTNDDAAVRFMERWLERWHINDGSRNSILDAVRNNRILTHL